MTQGTKRVLVPIPPPKPLTRMEKEVALLRCQGLGVKDIAEALRISPHTVETHRDNLYRKLKVHNVAQLIHAMTSRIPTA